ncbi:endonuclease [Runella rosea]|uniref:Endonuclease n=1 Tax=Runella rosea TaxID=2259595 RepID=A0A344TKZ2_9BACT|nr:endonuclease/exonuclease/phosphatase family protein [Runella rosea]AXE19313.1 endonuclease [Runella rosea]
MKLALQSVGIFLIIITFLPLVRSDYWTFRIFEFPRAQKLVVTLLLLLVYPFVSFLDSLSDWLLMTVLGGVLLHLVWQVYPFTPLAKKQLLKTRITNPDRAISVMMWNVYQYNRSFQPFLKLFAQVDADIVLLSETDQWWQQKLILLEKDYPYRVHVPLENTYGMLLYSKLPLLEEQVKYLVEDGVPSIHTDVQLRSGEKIRLFCIHPTPPVPQENPRSTERDKELLLIADQARSSQIPVLVCGDLNDVAWSYTTALFQKMSGLLDPRRGRGFFNTFHAKIPFLRFPLDHVFCSTEFTLIKMSRLKNSGSDHFPMYIKLQYTPRAAEIHEAPQPTAEEVETAQEKINKETREEGPGTE